MHSAKCICRHQILIDSKSATFSKCDFIKTEKFGGSALACVLLGLGCFHC